MKTQQNIKIQQQEPKVWPKVAIIILNWNGPKDTIECLESVRQLSYSNYLTIVVDNGSWDDSVERIKVWVEGNLGEGHALVEYTQATALQGGEEEREDALGAASPKAKLVLIRNEENLGFTGGNNVAIHYALQRKLTVDYVFLLSNDAKVAQDCLQHLVEVARKANTGIVGAVIKGEDGQIQFAGLNGSFPLVRQFFDPIVRWPTPPYESEHDFWPSFRVHGATMMVRKDVLRNIYNRTGRYLDNSLFFIYDEVEFCYVARKAGYESMIAKHAVVYHKEAGSSGGRYNPITYYYSNRNRMLLANELLPIYWKMLFHLVNVPLCLGRVLKNLVHRRTSSVRAILCGLIDGYRGITGKWKHHDREALGWHRLK